MIDRTKASGVIPTEMSNQIIKDLPMKSAALAVFPTRTMTTASEDQPVLSALPTAGFVDGDLGAAPSSDVEWKGKKLKSESLKISIVVPKNVIKDSKFPIWDEIRPIAAAAIAEAFDKAVILGVGAPASFGGGIAPAAIAAGNVVSRGTNTQAKGGLYKDLIDGMKKVAGQGYGITGFMASDLFEFELLGATDTQGQPLAQLSDQTKLVRRPLGFTAPGVWTPGLNEAELVFGDFSKAIIGIRQDIEYTINEQGVISDQAGNVLINLPSQGAVELILHARFAFVLANSATLRKRASADDATRCPFGVLRSPAA